MSLRQLSDNCVQDILVFHDLGTRRRLRRLWQCLLLSIYVNLTAILESSYRLDDAKLSSDQIDQFKSAVFALLHTHNVICRGAITPEGGTSLIRIGLMCLRIAVKNGNRRPLSSVIFVNARDWMAAIHHCTGGTFNLPDLLLINVHVDLSALFNCITVDLKDLPSSSSFLVSLAVKLVPLCQGEKVHIPYHWCKAVAARDGGMTSDRCSRLLALLPSLGAGYLRALQRSDLEQDPDAAAQLALAKISLWTGMNKILKELPSAWDMARSLPAGPVDWTELPNIVTWLAFSYFCLV